MTTSNGLYFVNDVMKLKSHLFNLQQITGISLRDYPVMMFFSLVGGIFCFRRWAQQVVTALLIPFLVLRESLPRLRSRQIVSAVFPFF